MLDKMSVQDSDYSCKFDFFFLPVNSLYGFDISVTLPKQSVQQFQSWQLHSCTYILETVHALSANLWHHRNGGTIIQNVNDISRSCFFFFFFLYCVSPYLIAFSLYLYYELTIIQKQEDSILKHFCARRDSNCYCKSSLTFFWDSFHQFCLEALVVCDLLLDS